MYPEFAGSFLLVSGLRFTFDHTKKPRVQEVIIGKEKLDLNKQYTVTVGSFLAGGGDGFHMLENSEVIIDEESGISLLNCLLKFFKASDARREF